MKKILFLLSLITCMAAGAQTGQPQNFFYEYYKFKKFAQVPYLITDTIKTPFSSGSILYVNSSGVIVQDNAGLSYSNGNVSVGQSDPAQWKGLLINGGRASMQASLTGLRIITGSYAGSNVDLTKTIDFYNRTVRYLRMGTTGEGENDQYPATHRNYADLNADLYPTTGNTYNLGSSDKKWNNLYVNTIPGFYTSEQTDVVTNKIHNSIYDYTYKAKAAFEVADLMNYIGTNEYMLIMVEGHYASDTLMLANYWSPQIMPPDEEDATPEFLINLLVENANTNIHGFEFEHVGDSLFVYSNDLFFSNNNKDVWIGYGVAGSVSTLQTALVATPKFYTKSQVDSIASNLSGGGTTTDTSSLSNRINLKANISDVDTAKINLRNATAANTAALAPLIADTTVYVSLIDTTNVVWSASTNPTWYRVRNVRWRRSAGGMVTATFYVALENAGSSVTGVRLPFPAALPSPRIPDLYDTSTGGFMGMANGNYSANLNTSAGLSTSQAAGIWRESGGTFMVRIFGNSVNAKIAIATVTYFTN